MLVDLHSHYPMHVVAGRPITLERMLSGDRKRVRDKLRAFVLRIANKLANYPRPGDKPAVTADTLKNSSVRVVLSVLYDPFSEMDLDQRYGAPPQPGYFEALLQQIDKVEDSIQRHLQDLDLARSPAELASIAAANKVALVHALEGGFHLGDTEAAVRANVETLAARGVAYITVAHLFWRRVATNTAALPFLPDFLYRLLFPQPTVGLTDLGRVAVRAMAQDGILIDLTHMSAPAFRETLQVLDEVDPRRTVPVIASHTACDFGRYQYNITDTQIAAIAERKGIVGLIACQQYMTDDGKPKSFADSIAVLVRHVDRIHQVTGSHEFTALGSDQDGFIAPTLPGLETPGELGRIEAELARHYGDEAAARICSGNALRVLARWTVRP